MRHLQGFALPQQVGTRVAYMRQRVRLAAQHQCRERGHAHGGAAALVHARQPGILAGDDAVQRHRGVPGLRRAVVVAQQADHGGLGRLLAHAALAHAIGHGSNCAHALITALRQHGSTKVFVDVFVARQGGKTNVYFKCHAPRVSNISACVQPLH